MVATVPEHDTGKYVLDPREVRRKSVVRRLESWEPDERGVMHGVYGPYEDLPPLKSRDAAAVTADSRLVTADASVHASWIRAEWFEPEDLLVVSLASQLDLHAAEYAAFDEGGTPGMAGRPGINLRSTPLPINGPVLSAFQTLSRVWLDGTPEQRSQLTTGDLLSAATALAYGLPLYTTRPTAYRFLKNGLKTVKYGPVRNPAIIDGDVSGKFAQDDSAKQRMQEQTASAVMVVADPAISAAMVRSRYESGVEFTEQDQQMIANAAGDFTTYAPLIFTIVGDEDHSDLSWATALLSHAHRVTHQVRSAPNRSEFVFAVQGIFPSAQYMDTQLKRDAYAAAHRALALWAEWSDDWEQMVEDLDETADPFSATWYLTLLQIRGVDSAIVEQERQAIDAGLNVLVSERFHDIVGEANV